MRIQYTWSPLTVSPSTAKALARSLLPNDSTLVRSFALPHFVVDEYVSKWLRLQLLADRWTRGQPGTFTVRYTSAEAGGKRYAGRIQALVIELRTD
ncbi:MAG: hypothetical protein HY332_00260 [Chloroflexi bacterium]|nr:hypothetical protein [Chloroflexota bacterium]